jgi:hypothetical protein
MDKKTNTAMYEASVPVIIPYKGYRSHTIQEYNPVALNPIGELLMTPDIISFPFLI